ncbi:DNA recombination protein RmuC [Nocardia fluminea]|uniref:DNA recombination protein RmuC n=1 Tax=Nocardia fluminea TaxID=134984 RepID=A0A2N3V5A8_9NOCA|nr:DNA recombination protein RmuC [Nocardia fluminea]
MIGIGVFVVMMIVVAALAGGIGFMVGRGRAAVVEEQARRWQESTEQMRRERDATREKAEIDKAAVGEQARIDKESAVERVRVERDEVAEQARLDRESSGEQLQALNEKVSTEAAARARAEAELGAVRNSSAEQIALLRDEQEGIKKMAGEVLEVVSGKMMKQVTDMVDQRAQATGKELDQRRLAVDELIKPLSTQVATLTEYVRVVEKDRVSSVATIGEQLQHLATNSEKLRLSSDQVREEAGRLVTALRRPQTRGKWGEQQLRNVVEAAGMLNQVDFVEQPSFATGENAKLRPDMVVRIGGQMSIVVDAKTPFDAFLNAHEARDDEDRKKQMDAHIKNVRRHIDQLTDKQYWDLPECSPEFVVMFVPSEVFLYAAFEQDPELWAYASKRNVVMAAPTSLLVLLKSVGAVLRQEAMAENAKVTAAMCTEMTKRLRDVAGHLNKVGTKLNETVEAFDATVGSMERRVLVQARKIDDLQGVDTDKPIPELTEVARTPRTLAIPAAAVADDSSTAA